MALQVGKLRSADPVLAPAASLAAVRSEHLDRFEPVAPEAVRRLEAALAWDEPVAEPLERIRSSERGLRVLWWNIEAGQTNRSRGDGALEKNLLRLAASPLAPDVIALGEFEPGALGEMTLKRLERSHPSVRFEPYNDRVERGILALSKKAPRSEGHAELPYTPPGASPEAAARYRAKWSADFPHEIYFDRRYSRLTIDGPEGSVNLVPIHTAQPWSRLQKSLPGVLGKLWAGLNVYLGNENPLMNQLARLRAALEADVLQDPGRASTLIIGDFNLPRGELIRSSPYLVASKDLVDVVQRNDRPSWPAKGSPTFPSGYPALRIDHAFVSEDLSGSHAEVLPLGGSDHYPIYAVAHAGR